MKTLDEVFEFFDNEEELELHPKRVLEEYLEDLKEYASQNDFAAMFMCYVIYSEGYGGCIEPNSNIADKWLGKMLKAEQNHKLHTSSKSFTEQFLSEIDADAMVYMLAADRSQELEDYKKANEYYRKLEKHNIPKSLRCLGENYFFGNGVEENSNKALDYFKKYFRVIDEYDDDVLDFNYAYSCFLTGLIYGYEKDDDNKALEYFIKGADLGHPPCQYYAGLFFTYRKDLDNAFDYLMKAVENEYVPALIEVGERCQFGIAGFTKSPGAAVNYYTQAIEARTDNAKPYVGLSNIYCMKDSGYYDPNQAIEYGKYALNNCNFEDEDDLDVLIDIADSYYFLGDYDNALAYAAEAKKYNIDNADECYDFILKESRKQGIFNLVDKVFKSPIVDIIPGVNFVAASYKAGAKLGEAFNNDDADGIKDGISSIIDMMKDDD